MDKEMIVASVAALLMAGCATAAGAEGDRQDWTKIVAAAEKSGVKWLVVECEKRQNTFDDIAESARNLRPLVSLVNALRQ